MSTFPRLSLTLALSFAPILPAAAGEESVVDDLSFVEQHAEPWVTPSLDLRLRYEFREVDPFDPSHAATARARFGLLTREVAGFSLFGELEATEALIDDYRSNPADASTSPFVANNTVIADPENFELNQGWLRYAAGGFTGTFGRQRIIRNNAAFIAHVGWRQNEQTYDALNLEYEANNTFVSYSYSNRALRIFGDDANDAPPGAPLRDFEGDFHFLDFKYAPGDWTAGAYTYLLDIDNNANVGRSNSFGGFFEQDGFRAEVAYQDGTSALAGGDYGAFYGHLTLSRPVAGSTVTAGYEYLGENFKTPFALLHAFNGFADAFATQRAGLNDQTGAYNGLNDIYLSCKKPGLPWDLTFIAAAHAYFDDEFSQNYGYEIDAVLSRKFSENVTTTLKAAWFIADDNGGFGDITQVGLQTDMKF